MTEATSRAAAKMPLTTPSLSAGIRWEVILSTSGISSVNERADRSDDQSGCGIMKRQPTAVS